VTSISLSVIKLPVETEGEEGKRRRGWHRSGNKDYIRWMINLTQYEGFNI